MCVEMCVYREGCVGCVERGLCRQVCGKGWYRVKCSVHGKRSCVGGCAKGL